MNVASSFSRISCFAGVLSLLLSVISDGLCADADTPLLEKTITISFQDEPIESALRKIAKAGNFTFSYSSSLLNEKETVTAQFSRKTIREVLDQLFKGKLDYRERGSYIILLKAKAQTSSRDSKVFSGYVVDEETGERLKNVSIYDPVTLSSAVTDEYGFFKIEIKRPSSDEIKLAVNKNQYTDTLLVVPSRNRRLLNIPIKVNKEKIGTVADSVGHKFKRLWLRTWEATQHAINMENISDTIYRKKQFGLAPFIGTNGALSGNVINDYSFNVLGGYSLGNRKAELAGLFNATRGDVQGIQVAGLLNGVLGKVRGTQLAGLANVNADVVKGVQIAGLVNIGLKPVEGIGLSGLSNITIGSQRGVYISGILNLATEDSGPVHVAGLFNLAEANFAGVQLAGLGNLTTKEMSGVQLAGLFNTAPDFMKGIQIATLNMAKEIQGSQIGLINVSKSMKGIPVGFLSIVAKGYHKLEVSADEVFYTNLAFRTGVRQFYNIFTVGAKPDSFEKEQTFWSFGYGVGTAPKLAKKIFLNLDITSSQIVNGPIEKINLLNKVYTGFDFQLAKNFSVTAGATLNGHLTDRLYKEYPLLFSDYTPAIIKERNFSNDLNLKMWWGAKIGIRFF